MKYPDKKLIEVYFPVEDLYDLALREGNRKKPIYEMHKWWARRLGVNFRMLLLTSFLSAKESRLTLFEKFYGLDNYDFLVLDPFMGGGTTIIEANKLGFRTIGIDIDPVAWYITKKEAEPWNEGLLNSEYLKIKQNVSNSILNYYKTKLKNGLICDVINFFWVSRIECPSCHHEFEGHIHYVLYENKKSNNKIVFCKNCHEIYNIPKEQEKFKCKACKKITIVKNGTVKSGQFKCPYCSEEGFLNAPHRTKSYPKSMYAIEYVNKKGLRAYKKPSRWDISLYQKACKKFNKIKSILPFPRDKIPTKNRNDSRPIRMGYNFYYELFNQRQLLSLSLIYREILKIEDINTKEYLLLAFSDCLASNNVLCSYAFNYRKLTPLFGLHAYRDISQPVETNVWGTKFGRGSFSRCFLKIVKGKNYFEKPYEYFYKPSGYPSKVEIPKFKTNEVTSDIDKINLRNDKCIIVNSDSRDLSWIPSKKVDLVLTDPPYYNNISYSELSDFYYVWIRDQLPVHRTWKEKNTPYDKALFVPKLSVDKIGEKIFTEGIIRIFKECHRVLKKDGLMVFTYHHNDYRAWSIIAQAIIESKFKIINLFPILSEGKSGFHSSSGNIKWDIVFCCKKKNVNSKTKKFNEHRLNKNLKHKLNYWIERLEKRNLKLNINEIRNLRFALSISFLIDKNLTIEDIQKILKKDLYS